MKKLLFASFISCSVALAACSGNAKTENTDSTPDSAAVDTTALAPAPVVEPQDTGLAIQSIREIYKMRPEQTYTPEFQQVINDAEAKAEKEGSEMGYFDYDILTNSQDPGNVKNIELLAFEGNDLARLKVYGSGFGEKGYVIVTAKLTDGIYLIDDVEGFDGKSVKESTKAYLK